MLCPICKKPVSKPAPGADASKYSPFCSDRCKLIDLGRWIDGKYQIPVVDRDDESNPRRDQFTTD
jgi:endogenous inhibitor of DNA gyrase (YacG/DUF329 family)